MPTVADRIRDAPKERKVRPKGTRRETGCETFNAGQNCEQEPHTSLGVGTLRLCRPWWM